MRAASWDPFPQIQARAALARHVVVSSSMGMSGKADEPQTPHGVWSTDEEEHAVKMEKARKEEEERFTQSSAEGVQRNRPTGTCTVLYVRVHKAF